MRIDLCLLIVFLELHSLRLKAFSTSKSLESLIQFPIHFGAELAKQNKFDQKHHNFPGLYHLYKN
jgi:hypothetical protein